MAPSTYAYRAEIAKSRVIHKGTKVQDRVQLRYPSGSTSKAVFAGGSGTSSKTPDVKPCPSPEKKRASPSEDDEDDTPLAFYNRELKKVKVAKVETDPNFWVPDPSEDDIVLSSELEMLEKHEYELDKFLMECGLSTRPIRKIMKKAKIQTWSDLVPCSQMTESTLTTLGIKQDDAAIILAKAQEWNEEALNSIDYTSTSLSQLSQILDVKV
ncbi:uncharacterized protein MELLADRAFT_89090 [Melampsora larici-populina 98AG31]|uniref:Uncharacterized protein n=1 Tax=Melampsora larici-populina (strain 98AG31 / pathotype 3-4-7) TaxID=747676 RepID=F4R6Z5_MELLP|nr:uncharacterized protein MELLADRAFT_89090 [Melampsora larici-populina 98AG31]EGG12367.1 hypothetical protein MELLADRAFT_89090 [Melampsora larici-populina 98AG31]